MEIIKIVGSTPLLKISERVYGKLETYNPTGSVKDRVITYLVSRAIQDGEIKKDTILCEATSGNTGIALSACAASLGVPCNIYMPSNMSDERKQMMKAFGASVIESDPDAFDMAIDMRDLFMAQNNNAWSPMQFSNEKNIECHQTTTAPEIHSDVKSLGKQWGAFVHGAGTGGTIEGVRKYVESSALKTKTCMVIPAESPHKIQGIGDGKEFLAKSADMDAVEYVPSDVAIAEAQAFARQTGLLVGISSGANIYASKKYVEKHNIKGVVVTMLCDRGERYMTVFG